MAATMKALVGISKDEFDEFVRCRAIRLRSARLIPLINPGKEEALTSIFLSSLTLVDEFRKDILSVVGIPTSGQLYVYTEVVFPDQKDFRIDGLIMVVRGGVIKDAAILEMKNGSDILDAGQVDNYLQIAKMFSINKMITVSNEFVSDPTQSPLGSKKTPKGVELYHFSWQFIRTLARIRLFKNDTNIADTDQVRIMEEVVAYFEHEKSGVCGFSQMKPGWKTVVEKVASRATLNKTDSDLKESVASWVQEEGDLALKLSCRLGVLVRSGSKKYKGDIQARMNDDTDMFLKNPVLSSTLSVAGAVSDISVRADFQTKTVEMSVDVMPPQDKTVKGQFGWIRGQVENKKLKKKLMEGASATSILDEICIELVFKHARKPFRFPYKELDSQMEACKGQDIKNVSVVYVKNFGAQFASPRKFIENIEAILPLFYEEIVQYLTNWTKPAPKISTHRPTEDAPVISDPGQRLRETESELSSNLADGDDSCG